MRSASGCLSAKSKSGFDNPLLSDCFEMLAEERNQVNGFVPD
jgi:hypothetical protein